ncbi:MAG TPA: hypothetical protein VLF67_01515 [Candidatus Saccharimonas sp.]|nr:hypothetical protein [Candidatus Saccharimonas sp.]
MMPSSNTIRRWRRSYQLLIKLYPADHRAHYAAPMLQIFDDLVRDAPHTAVRQVMLAALLDTAVSIAKEQATALKQRFIIKETPMSKRPFYIRHRLALSVIGGVLVVAAALSATTIVKAAVSAVRLARINAVYDSLHLGKDYFPGTQMVFGDKRVYDWDKSRTQSSMKMYTHDANVDTTVADLRGKIEAAGFKYIGEPYPGSAQTQLHFQSGKHTFIRLTVASAHREAAAQTGDLNILTVYDQTHTTNEAPSEVTIKVNLDDNNE